MWIETVTVFKYNYPTGICAKSAHGSKKKIENVYVCLQYIINILFCHHLLNPVQSCGVNFKFMDIKTFFKIISLISYYFLTTFSPACYERFSALISIKLKLNVDLFV